MADLIDRAALLVRLNKVCLTDDVFGMGMQMGIDHAIAVINEAPTFTDVPDNNVGDSPVTNGDRIRAMTDEELCDFILDKRENGTCFNDRCYHNDPNKGCDYCTLEWLKQPATEGM